MRRRRQSFSIEMRSLIAFHRSRRRRRLVYMMCEESPCERCITDRISSNVCAECQQQQ